MTGIISWTVIYDKNVRPKSRWSSSEILFDKKLRLKFWFSMKNIDTAVHRYILDRKSGGLEMIFFSTRIWISLG